MNKDVHLAMVIELWKIIQKYIIMDLIVVMCVRAQANKKRI